METKTLIYKSGKSHIAAGVTYDLQHYVVAHSTEHKLLVVRDRSIVYMFSSREERGDGSGEDSEVATMLFDAARRALEELK